MKEIFSIVRKINGIEVNHCNLSKKQISLINEGITYAYVKDSNSERKEEYKKIKKEILRMMTTRATK